MISDLEWTRRKADLLDAFEMTTKYRGHFPMVAFVERAKATASIQAKAWMEVTDRDVIEYAKAHWKPHPSQAVLVTCDPNDPSREDVICVVLPQV